MLTFRFSGADGKMIEDGILTSGMVGKEIKLEFSAEWTEMTKTVVFVAGKVTRDVVNVSSDVIPIPAEVLVKPYSRLRVGVYGMASGGRVTPTIYADGPIIHAGANPSGDESSDPDLPVWAQILEIIEELRANGADPEMIRQIVTEYLETDAGIVTKATRDLENYYRKDQSYNRDEIDQRISQIPKFSIQVVTALPTTDIGDTTIYLVPGGAGSDLYTEYIHINGAWEVLGSQRVDLSGYATEAWVTALLDGKLDADKLPEAVNAALAQAKKTGEFDGPKGDPGQDGEDGITPHIGINGNWYIGDQDTGKPSRGEPGKDGEDSTSTGGPSNVKNVMLYGATGDGVTDDTAAIAAAIAALNPGDTLYFPEGVYRVRNIELKSDMIVQGAGWCSVIQLLDATTDYQGNNNCLNIEGTKNNPIRNIIIRDIKLDGTRSTQRSGGDSQDGRLDGIKIRYATDILVENVWMYNNGYHGCIMTFASNVVFERCKATDNGFRPIHGHTQIRNCRVANCVCENNGLGVSGGSGFENDSIYFFGAEDLVICNNIVKSNRRGCITVGCEQDHSAENIIPTRNITISGNVCECYEDLAYVPTEESDSGVAKFSSMGIVIYGGNHVLDNVSVVGNTIRNAHEAIRLYAQENELCSLNAVINGNTIMDCSYGIYADDVADVIVSDNQAKSLAIAWMSARNIAVWQIHGNNINAPDASEHLCQISRSNNVVIRDNNMIGNGVAVYAPSPNSGIVVVNNTLYGFSGMVPVLNPDGATAGNILDATLDEDTANEATQKVCVDPYPNAGFVRPTLANPNTGSTSWSYTTPVPITPDDISYELNTYVSVPVGTAPGDYNYPSVYTGIVFLAGTELTDAVGIATITNGKGTVIFSDSCNPGTNNNTWGVRISLTAQAVKELFPTATHVMMQVEAWHSDPESLSNAYHTLNDGHAYVYRSANAATQEWVREYAQPKGNYALAEDVLDDDHINGLIQNALGVIENGSY